MFFGIHTLFLDLALGVLLQLLAKLEPLQVLKSRDWSKWEIRNRSIIYFTLEIWPITNLNPTTLLKRGCAWGNHMACMHFFYVCNIVSYYSQKWILQIKYPMHAYPAEMYLYHMVQAGFLHIRNIEQHK